MKPRQRIVRERRQYNQWVASQTLEDYALRYTAARARKSAFRVGNTAFGPIAFLAWANMHTTGAPFRFGNALRSFYNQPDEDFASSGQRAVSAELYRLAGMDIADMDVAMVYDHFTAMVIMSLEDFGFCPKE